MSTPPHLPLTPPAPRHRYSDTSQIAIKAFLCDCSAMELHVGGSHKSYGRTLHSARKHMALGLLQMTRYPIRTMSPNTWAHSKTSTIDQSGTRMGQVVHREGNANYMSLSFTNSER